MEIEIYPRLINKEHACLNTYLNNLLNNNIKNEKLLIQKRDYFSFYCEDGIYDIINDKIYKNDFHKTALDRELSYNIKHKNKHIITYLNVNYSNVQKTNRPIDIYCLPFNHIIDKRTKYTLFTSKNSKTRCEIIFDDYNKLIDVIFFIQLPKHIPSSKENIDTYIMKYVENTENELTNIYSESFYSLISTIIYML